MVKRRNLLSKEQWVSGCPSMAVAGTTGLARPPSTCPQFGHESLQRASCVNHCIEQRLHAQNPARTPRRQRRHGHRCRPTAFHRRNSRKPQGARRPAADRHVSNVDSGRKLRNRQRTFSEATARAHAPRAPSRLSIRDAARDHVARVVAARSGATGAARGFDAAMVSAAAFTEGQTFARGALARSRRVRAVRLGRAKVVEIAACRDETQTREKPEVPCQRTIRAPAPRRPERTPTRDAQLHAPHPAIGIPTSCCMPCRRRRFRKALQSHHRGTVRVQACLMLLSNDHTRWDSDSRSNREQAPRSSR